MRDGGAWDSDVRTPTRLNDDPQAPLRLACVRDGRIEPYAGSAPGNELWRDWRLSEVNVASRRFGGEAIPSDYADGVGYDLHKSPAILKAAYQNEEAAIANKNALTCINNYFDGDFDPDNFEFTVLYDSIEQRCETHLRSLTDHVAQLRRLGLILELKGGETICTGYQRKL